VFNRNKAAERQARYYSRHRVRLNLKRNKVLPYIREEARIRAHLLLGNKCAVCGISDGRVLEVDHKNGGGCKERRKEHSKERNTLQLYWSIIREKEFREKLQLLCANCHKIKTWEDKNKTS